DLSETADNALHTIPNRPKFATVGGFITVKSMGKHCRSWECEAKSSDNIYRKIVHSIILMNNFVNIYSLF
ncbi:MAG: hypothetical protein QXI16_01635, partial [Sulfolobaceae archaeon]